MPSLSLRVNSLARSNAASVHRNRSLRQTNNLPNSADRISRDNGVRRKQCHFACDTLRNEEPVKWICVDCGQAFHGESRRFVDRQRKNTARFAFCPNKVRRS
jgi:hypothetical protein